MFKLFFSPSGRINRGQYWIVHLAFIPLLILAITPFFFTGKTDVGLAFTQSLGILILVIPLAIWFNICSTIKRYHDRGKSGWWYLMIFVPIIGEIWHFIECGILQGDTADNEYGPATSRVTYRTSNFDTETILDKTKVGYEQAIQNALSAHVHKDALSKQQASHKPTQQYYDRPRESQPFFGRRT
jgi:uncharacterized membrane protein YhaH (DUF805 family)